MGSSEPPAGDQPPPLPKTAQLRVLTGVCGTDKVYCLPAEQPTSTVVFFVGDQLEAKGLPAKVLELQEPKRQAALMAAKFPGASVAVVIPSRLEACFACFDHFLNRTTASGEPLGYHGQGFKAASQLTSLLRDGGLWGPPPPPPPVPSFHAAPQHVAACRSSSPASAAARASGPGNSSAAADPAVVDAGSAGDGPSQGPNTSGSNDDSGSGGGGSRGSGSGAAARLPVKLVGFSKGGTVLNQVLAELGACAAAGKASGRLLHGGDSGSGHLAHSTAAAASGAGATPPADVDALLRSIVQLHFLDVGLNCRGAYLTHPQVAADLRCMPAGQREQLRIVLHGTPRQWEDPTRPWIAREAQRCAELLQEAGLSVVQRKYFDGETPSLLMHFEIIEEMQAC